MKLFHYLVLLPTLILAASCQGEEAESSSLLGSSIVFRVEVPEGTEGAIACDGLQGTAGTVWFGAAHPYHLSYAGPTTGSDGAPVLAFEIVAQEKVEFADFTEAIIGKRMAIEINGKIYSAPSVNGRLPGGGLLTGDKDGFTQEEVDSLVKTLREGSA